MFCCNIWEDSTPAAGPAVLPVHLEVFRIPVNPNQVKDAEAVVNQAGVEGAVESPKNAVKIESLHVTLKAENVGPVVAGPIVEKQTNALVVTDNSSALDKKGKVKDPEACASVVERSVVAASVECVQESTKTVGISFARALLESL